MDRTVEQDYRTGQHPNMHSKSAGYTYLCISFREICYSPLDIFSTAEGTGDTDYKPICDYWKRYAFISNSCQIYKFLVDKDLRKHLLHPAAWWDEIYVVQGYTRLHNVDTENTGACVHSTSIETLFHRNTTSTATSAMSVDTSQDCCGTANGPQICYVSQLWLVLPDVTTWSKTKHHTIIWLIGHNVRMFWGMVVLLPCMTYTDFL
jgi:hypothetical protein